MDILLVTDNKYVMPTGVLMYSIGVHNVSMVHFHVIVDDNFTEKNSRELNDIADKFSNKLTIYKFPKHLVERFPYGRDGQPQRVSIATYYRLFASEILPQSVHKVIYLDGDMIVRHSLLGLWSVDLQDNAIAVVPDQNEKRHCASNRLPYPMERGYFNAGMLLINLDYWRRNNCLTTFIEFIECNADCILWHDQDVLNSVFYDKKVNVQLTYNFQDGFLFLPEEAECSEKIQPEIVKYALDPVIIHYTVIKPWNIICFQPMCAVWRYYWRKTIWRNNKLEGEESHSLKEWLRNKALRYNWFVPKDRYRKIILRK